MYVKIKKVFLATKVYDQLNQQKQGLPQWTTVKGTKQKNMGSLPPPAKSSNRYLLHSFNPVHKRDLPPLLLLAWIVFEWSVLVV